MFRRSLTARPSAPRSILLGAALWLFGFLTMSGSCSAALSETPTVKLGFLDFEREASYSGRIDNVQRSLTEYLRSTYPHTRIEVVRLSSKALREAVQFNDVDYFLASSGFFVEMMRLGARDLGTLVSKDFPNPNACVAGVMVVRRKENKRVTIADLFGLRAVSTNPLNFMSYVSNLGSIAAAGYDPDRFFTRIDFTNDNTEQVLLDVASGRADVGLLRACTYEAILARRPDLRDAFSVVDPPHTDELSFACARSTTLYPGWTFAASPGVSPELTRQMTKRLLDIQPGDLISDYTVSVTTDYGKVETLFKKLKRGPYEHLRHWTLRRIWELLWPIILFCGGLLTAWIIHWIRLEHIVKTRTSALQQAHTEADTMKLRLEKLQRIGIVNQLSSIFAHDIAQPMAAMDYWLHSMTTLIKRGNPDPELITTCLESLRIEQRNAAKILDQVRLYAKRDVHRDVRHSLNAIAKNVVNELQRSHVDNNLIKIKESNNVFAFCDEIEIKIVLINLLRNAIEATKQPSDPIVVTIGITQLQEAFLRVENPGDHMSEEEFQRLNHPLDSQKAHGLGLGIQICRTIAEAHAARLQFIRRPQGGLSVDFIFSREN